MPEVACLICGEPAVEIQLCNDHFYEYHEWKRLDDDYTSENRVDEFVDLCDEITGYVSLTEQSGRALRARLS